MNQTPSVAVDMEYKCGHIRRKHELLHEGHNLQDKLDWFKKNLICHDCATEKKQSNKDI